MGKDRFQKANEIKNEHIKESLSQGKHGNKDVFKPAEKAAKAAKDYLAIEFAKDNARPDNYNLSDADGNHRHYDDV